MNSFSGLAFESFSYREREDIPRRVSKEGKEGRISGHPFPLAPSPQSVALWPAEPTGIHPSSHWLCGCSKDPAALMESPRLAGVIMSPSSGSHLGMQTGGRLSPGQVGRGQLPKPFQACPHQFRGPSPPAPLGVPLDRTRALLKHLPSQSKGTMEVPSLMAQ